MMSEELKERFRDRADTVKQWSAYMEKMSRKTRAFSTPEIEYMKVQAESMRNGSLQIGRFLKIHRKDRDQGLALLKDAERIKELRGRMSSQIYFPFIDKVLGHLP
jgi:hypothetical protein